MPNSAKARGDIRTPQSHARQKRAKEILVSVLDRQGFVVRGWRNMRNRHVIDASDPSGRRRVLWFKLGWKPENHRSSAVQITMLKVGADRKRPSKLSNSQVLKRVGDKFVRAKRDGVTDLLLFSTDNSNEKPIAALLLPIEEATNVFEECMTIGERVTRNGASPALWLLGNSDKTQSVAALLRRRACQDLLESSGARRSAASGITDDAFNDFLPNATTIGDQSPQKYLCESSRYQRDDRIRQLALTRASGKCEYCGALGFELPDKRRYLECHHIRSLGQDGPDTMENVIALCANDHRRAHFGTNPEEFSRILLAKLSLKLRGSAGSS